MVIYRKKNFPGSGNEGVRNFKHRLDSFTLRVTYSAMRQIHLGGKIHRIISSVNILPFFPRFIHNSIAIFSYASWEKSIFLDLQKAFTKA